MWGAIASGWGIPAIALTVALVFSGVSFRFGRYVPHQSQEQSRGFLDSSLGVRRLYRHHSVCDFWILHQGILSIASR